MSPLASRVDEPRPYFCEIDADSELAAKAAKRSARALRTAIREAYADVPA